MSYSDMIAMVKVICPVVRFHYPGKANHERMSLYVLVAFSVMDHIVFDDVYRKAYGLFVEGLKLFPDVRYNKVVERLNRYEGLLLECLRIFRLEVQVMVDSKPLKTKRLVRYSRHRKRLRAYKGG